MDTPRFWFAVIHLWALSIGIAAAYARWRSLKKVKSTADLATVFLADNWYGVAFLLWVVTGLFRAFGGLEKGTDHYLGSHWFIGKMGLLGVVLALEIMPMVTLMRWRWALKKGGLIDLGKAAIMARLTLLELPLLMLIVLLAAAMARGL